MTRHAVLRALERYGLLLTPEEQRDVEEWIARRDPRAIFLRTQGDDPTGVYAVLVQGRWVVARVAAGIVVTFNPPDDGGASLEALNFSPHHGAMP